MNEHQKIIDKIVLKACEVIEAGNKIFPKHQIDIEKIQIDFTEKGTAAGRATITRLGIPYIQYNIILAEDNEQEFLVRTVPHEIGHIYALMMNPKCHHGNEWYIVMYRLGYPQKRCHNYDTSKVERKMKRVKYTCECGKIYNLSIRTYNRIVRDERHYHCAVCKKSIIIE